MLRACELKTMFSGSISWETWDPKPIMFGSIQGHGRQARPIFFLREVLEKNIVKFSTNDLYDLGHLTIAIWILWERSPKPKIARHSHMWQRAYRFFGCTYVCRTTQRNLSLFHQILYFKTKLDLKLWNAWRSLDNVRVVLEAFCQAQFQSSTS